MWISSRTWTHVGAEKEEEKNREKRRRAVRRERERGNCGEGVEA